MHKHFGDADAHTRFRSGAFDWQRLAKEQTARIPLADRWWDLLGKPIGKTLADIGCGPGVLAAHYAKLGADVLAVDLQSDALDRVPAHARLRTLVHDLEAAPLPERVDALILSDVLHHAAKPVGMLRNARLSADRILIADHDVGHHAGPPSESRPSPDRVAQMLREAGFNPRPIAHIAPGQYAVVADAA